MRFEEQLNQASAALGDGRWQDARIAFEASLAQQETAEALEGLAQVHWWLCDARASVRYRERAWVLFRQGGEAVRAGRVAVDLSISYLVNLGNDVAARGWLARAERLTRRLDPNPLQGWLWLMQGYMSGDAERARADTSRALELAQETGDADLEGLHAAVYRALLDQYAGAFSLNSYDRVSLQQMGEVVMYLLEAATNPGLLVVGSSRHDSIEFRHPPLDVPAGSRLAELLLEYGQYETPRKFIELAKMVATNVELGRKTLIWSNFVRNIETLERMLARYKPAVIHGGVPSEITIPNAVRTREAELGRFRADRGCMVLLANPAATAEGVSLHDVCHDAIYLDRTFNAGQYLQSVDRIHRLGLRADEETRVSFLLTAGTIDMRVDRRVREKATLLGEMLDDHDIATMALPDDEDYGPAIDSPDDLVALFAHLRGEDVP